MKPKKYKYSETILELQTIIRVYKLALENKDSHRFILAKSGVKWRKKAIKNMNGAIKKLKSYKTI